MLAVVVATDEQEQTRSEQPSKESKPAMSEPHDQHKKPADAAKPILGFAAGTPIRTPEGSKPIEDVKPGDMIGSAPGGQVQEVFLTEQPIFLLRLGSNVIRTTAEHPFYVSGKGWISAAEMPGATSEGEEAVVPNPNPGEQPTLDQPRRIYPFLGFVAGTPIRTPEGHTPIEELKPGDLIQSQPDDGQGDHQPEAHEDDHTGEDARWWDWN